MPTDRSSDDPLQPEASDPSISSASVTRKSRRATTTSSPETTRTPRSSRSNDPNTSEGESTYVVTWVESPTPGSGDEVLITVTGERTDNTGQAVANFELRTTLGQWNPHEFLIEKVAELGLSLTSLHVDLNFAEATFH